jgi:hypothetical protein
MYLLTYVTVECYREVSTFNRENYLFVCQCPKCLSEADDADITSDEEEEMEGDEPCHC